jgi:SNF2 family DNA or RNA helicase
LVPGSGIEAAFGSAKLLLLMESLEESLDLGHRALIFSQWTSLLDLVELRLNEKSIRFSRLDGTTRNRDVVVSSFQKEDGPPVMLLSLKAGGVGITLTAADHIYILDPWWNPAAEDQAADRAHRIGQLNPVFIHRLVARNSVEDKILQLQKRKRALAEGILSEADTSADLTKEDLLGLLQSL